MEGAAKQAAARENIIDFKNEDTAASTIGVQSGRYLTLRLPVRMMQGFLFILHLPSEGSCSSTSRWPGNSRHLPVICTASNRDGEREKGNGEDRIAERVNAPDSQETPTG